jgi:hypothetical protein
MQSKKVPDMQGKKFAGGTSLIIIIIGTFCSPDLMFFFSNGNNIISFYLRFFQFFGLSDSFF